MVDGWFEFDIQKYRHEIPQGWEILPRMQPLVVKKQYLYYNYYIISCLGEIY